MLVIAHTMLDPRDMERWQRAYPDAQFTSVRSITRARDLANRGVIGGLILTKGALRQRGYARLSVLKAAHPEIAVIAYLDPDAHLAEAVYALGRAGCNAILVRQTEDHPDHLRTVFTIAGMRSVADVVYAGCTPAPSLLTPANLERPIRRVATIQRVPALAAAMGSTSTSLRGVLREARLPAPKRFLACLRLLVASRRLGDGTESVERVGLTVGYSSRPAFHNACHSLIGATPGEIRNGGGLVYVGPIFASLVGRVRLQHGG